MTFSRIKAVGWQVNEKVTSGQLNQLDLDHFHSLDKTGDNLSNSGGITGRVDVISGGTLQIQSGGQLIFQSGGSGVINTGATVGWFGGSTLTMNNTSALEMNDSSGITFNGNGNLILGSSASELCAGTLNITSGGTLGINSGATMHVKSGATETVDSGGNLTVAAGGNLNVSSGGNINLNSGSFLNATNATTTFNGNLVILEGGLTMTTSGTGNFVTIGSGNTLNVHGTHKTDSFPIWNTPQTRQLVESTVGGFPLAGSWTAGPQFVFDNGTGGVWTMQIRRSHQGATLAQIFVGFSVGTGHSAVPANRPSLSVVRYRWDQMFNPQPLSTTDPQVFPNPGSGSAYYDSGNQQFMNYICNQNNVIDNENYIYALTITDESGANSAAFNAFGLVTLEFQIINDQKWSM